MNAVLLGGNGYIGRNFTEKWIKKDSDINIYVLSRSGKNKLTDKRITNISVDVGNSEEVFNALPEKVDYVVDFVGGLGGDNVSVEDINIKPAKTMLEIVNAKNVPVMGYVGGVLGSKDFTQTKTRVINMLKDSSAKLAVVEPTLVYGNGLMILSQRWFRFLKYWGFSQGK